MRKNKESLGQSTGKRVLCISGLVCLFLATGLAQAPARSTAQTTATVTVTFNNATLRDVIWEIAKTDRLLLLCTVHLTYKTSK